MWSNFPQSEQNFLVHEKWIGIIVQNKKYTTQVRAELEKRKESQSAYFQITHILRYKNQQDRK